MTIQPGQTYRSADPRDSIRIRIKSYTPGENRALVVDASTGKRPRPMLVNALHDSATTQAGKPRRSGYVLEQPASGKPAPGVVDEFIRDMVTQHPACACTHPQDRHLSACTECPCIGYAPTWPPQTTGQADTETRCSTCGHPIEPFYGADWIHTAGSDTGCLRATAPTTGQAGTETMPCICGHQEQRHVEDVCQDCGCGDYLEPADARDVINRWRTAALEARAQLAAASAVGQPAEAQATDEAEILARAASNLCAFGHGEAAAFLRDRIKALVGPGTWVPQYGRPLTPEEQAAETQAAADTVEDER
ncbi:hypothetical protein ACH4TP_38015 [Streptomyces sp. NPDC021012]|uniref:hypothetical protein n=1 Tax=Streptomyces sp. NPDC021012 TaxID=3365107 RepID=UPI00378760C3